MRRARFIVEVKLDDQHGAFRNRDTALYYLQKLLRNGIGKYEPVVIVAPDDSDTEQQDTTKRLLKAVLNSDNTLDIINLPQEEARTLWFALDHYKEELQATATNGEASYQDQLFCYGELRKIALLQYSVAEDYSDQKYAEKIRNWLGVP